MITIKNVSSALLYIVFPDLKIHRQLRPNQSFRVSAEDYDNMIFDAGFSSMIDEHFLSVKADAGEKTKNDIVETKVFDAATIKAMYENNDFTGFAKFIPNAAPAEKDTAAQLAIDMGITNGAFVELIKKYCGVDVINSINIKHQLEN